MADVPLMEDWVYGWSAFQFAETGTIKVLDLAAANGVFEALWGGLFSIGHAPSFGALRLSTLVLSAAGGAAFWSLLGDLGLEARSRTLGLGAYLFNPLSMALSFSFMTDAHALALSVIAMAILAKGLKSGRLSQLAFGSVFVGLGYLSRPQVVAPMIGAVLIVIYRWRDRRLQAIASLVTIPVAIATVLAFWRPAGTTAQGEFFSRAIGGSFSSILTLAAVTVVVLLGYVGFFCLPLTMSARWSLTESVHPSVLAPGLALLGFSAFAGLPFPVGDWLTSQGVGPTAFANYGGLPAVVSGVLVWPFTFVCAVSVSLLVAAVRSAWDRLRADLVISWIVVSLVIAMLAILPASSLFEFAPPDRYFLPLLPLVLALVLWALKGQKTRLLPAWLVVVVFAVFSTAGVHDSLEAEQAVWLLGAKAVERGIPLNRLSAGPSWDGFHFGPETSMTGEIDYRIHARGKPWWLIMFAPQIEPEFYIRLTSPAGLDVVDRVYFPTWLTAGEGVALLVKSSSPGT